MKNLVLIVGLIRTNILPVDQLSEITLFIQIKFGNHHTIGELIGSMAHRRPHVQSTFSFFGEVLLFWVAKKDIMPSIYLWLCQNS